MRRLECPVCQKPYPRWRLFYSIRTKETCLNCKSTLSVSLKSHLIAELIASITIIIAFIILVRLQKLHSYPHLFFFVLFSILYFKLLLMWFAEFRRSEERKAFRYIYHYLTLSIFFIIAIGLFYTIFSLYKTPNLKIPQDLKEEGVVIKKIPVSKNLFLEDANLGLITDIKIGSNSNIIIAGTYGAVVLDSDYKIRSRIKFKQRAAHVDIIKTNSKTYFMNRGSCRCCDPSLINQRGNILWTYSGTTCVFDMNAGDLDGDGRIEFVVGFNGSEGIHLVDMYGNNIWRQPDKNVWHIEIIDIEDDGIKEIVHSNALGEIVIRDVQGNILTNKKPIPYLSEFSIVQWPDKKGKKYILVAGDNLLWILDFVGNTVARLEAPRCNQLGYSRGILLRNYNKSFFAVVVEYNYWNLSSLYIYNSRAELVYMETIKESCASIATINSNKGNKESLLVGCEDKIWQYIIK